MELLPLRSGIGVSRSVPIEYLEYSDEINKFISLLKTIQCDHYTYYFEYTPWHKYVLSGSFLSKDLWKHIGVKLEIFKTQKAENIFGDLRNQMSKL